MKGVIFDIQRYSSHDGPGIRSTVFFKGCGLRCLWCHNPESFDIENNIYYTAESCIGCGSCEKACAENAHLLAPDHRYDRSKCILCGACISVCPSRALELSGHEYTVDEVWKTLERDIPFYTSSGGGVTLSGGEALLQSDFAQALLQKCKEEGLHTVVDTAGFVSWQAFEKILPYTDLFLYDIKAVTPILHKKATGQDNALILENYAKLVKTGTSVWVRIPIVPGFTASEEELTFIADFLKTQEPDRVELLQFHRMAKSKYRSLGMNYLMAETVPPSMEDMEKYRVLMARKLTCEIHLG